MKRSKFLGWGEFLLLLVLGGVYLKTQSESIYGGDAGDLVSAIIAQGIPHPPGYPLYTAIGVLVTKVITFGSVAWRVGFLSSIPSILSFLFLYKSLIYLTSKKLLSLAVVLTIAFLYPVWLYSSVAEVFALNSLFLSLLIYALLRLRKERRVKYLYLTSFILGLSLTHHHIIIFMIPAVLLVLKGLKILRRHYLKSLFYLLTGLTPYAYVFIAAAREPVINWMGAPAILNFWQLVTRAGYGTFRAGGFTAHNILSRLLNIWAYGNIFYTDFRLLGTILTIVGLWAMWKRERKIFRIVVISITSYLFFLFYASFPLVDNFLVGTFERFVQPIYLLTAIPLLYGMMMLVKIPQKILSAYFTPLKIKLLTVLLEAVFLIYPLGIFSLNYPKISILKKDLTAENFAGDLLDSLPSESIIILTNDTSLFDTQYLYYAKNLWTGVKIIHSSKLYTPYYLDQLKKYYPMLRLEDKSDKNEENAVTEFILDNYDNFPVYSKTALKIDGGVFIPYGLVFRFYKAGDEPDKNYILQENTRLWKTYHDPLEGSLAKFQNLMLSDVLKNYAFAHQETGFWAAKNRFHEFAREHLLMAEKILPQDPDSYIILAQVEILEKNCQSADLQLDSLLRLQKDSLDGLYLKSINYAACFKDSVKASEYAKLYEENKRGQEIKLNKL